MVSLPTTPLRAPPNATPSPGVTPGQVAQPYEEFASTLSTVGHEAGEVAKPLAREAGVRAVTRDPGGDLQIEHLPIIGPAADEFAKAAKWSYLAQSAAEARQKDLEISRQHQNDPDSYLKAATTFRDDYVAKATKTAGAEVGVELSRIIDSTNTQQYNSLLAQKQAMIRHNFDRDTSAIIKDAQVDLFTLIESGGLDTPDGRKQANDLIGRVINTYHARTGSILNAPPAEMTIAVKRFDEEVGAAKFSSDIKKILQADPEEGTDKALSVIDANFNDQSIPSSQRVANRDHALNTIKDFSQERVKMATMAARLQKQKDDLFEDALIRSTATGSNIQITENDIKKNPDISPAMKIKSLQYLKHDGMPEPLARVSQQTKIALMSRIRSGEMQGNGEIYEALEAGKLNRADFKMAREEYEQARTPQGEALVKDRGEFWKRYSATIDPSFEDKPTALGSQKMYAAEKAARRVEDSLRAKGLDPHLVYNPDSEYFFGKPANIGKYRATLQEQADYRKTLSEDQRRKPDVNLTGPGKDFISTTVENKPITLPPLNAREANRVYPTPSGLMRWTGTGWVRP